MSEALLFAEHGENMLCTKIVLNVRNNFCTQHVLSRFELGIFMYSTCNSMNNLSSYCGLVDAKIRASDKDLPVCRSGHLFASTFITAKLIHCIRIFRKMDFSFMVCHQVSCCKFVATNTAEILEWIQGNLFKGIDNIPRQFVWVRLDLMVHFRFNLKA